jgi:hypothetical protein
MPEPLRYRRLRAPRVDGGILADPPLSAAGTLLTESSSQRALVDYDFRGRRLSQLIASARGELLQAALAYSNSYLERPIASLDAAAPFVLAGHQPQLFHPGVWIKNFALAELVRDGQAVGVNLVVDTDTARSAAALVPGGTSTAPIAAGVPYDAALAEMPYEERGIADFELLTSFSARAAERLRPLVANPLVTSFWPDVVERGRATGNLGLAVAQARHRLEAEWGCQTLEVPQSQVCQFESFCWFAVSMLSEASRLRDVYNSALREYRRVNGVRSRSHPVPDLVREGDWIEAPFWVWSAANPRRRRLFVRTVGDDLQLTDRAGWQAALPLSGDGAAAALCSLPGGVKLRTRALLTTLFARVVLSDLFLHGIGGAKYDELTDLLITRFFDLPPPPYQVLSATLRLPIERPKVDDEDVRRVDGLLRELTYHPEVHAHNGEGPPHDGFARLVEDKRQWIATALTPENARERHLALRGANEGLQPWVAGLRTKLLTERDQLAELARADAVLASREYAFCLFPEQELRELFQQVHP